MLAIINAKVLTITRGTIDKGTVLLDAGKIFSVGAKVEIPAGAQIIDAAGKIVTPGFVDAHCHAGIWEEGFGWEGDDVNEMTDPVTPHVRAIDAINPEDQGLRDAVEGGITAIWSAPGSGNVIGGEGVTLKTHGGGRAVDQMVIRDFSGLKAATGENPKRIYSKQKKTPSTRMGTAAVLRDTLVKGQNYLAKLEKGKIDPEKAPERDLKLEAVARVLRGEIPLRVHAHRADDIMTAIRIAEEFNIRITIEHCTEGHKIAGELARRNIPAVVGPSLTARVKVELRDRTLATAGLLARAGVKVAIMTDHPVIPINFLPFCAALAIREGMPEEEALKAVTINSAEIIGAADRIGSIEPGKDADLVIWAGHPFELRSRVEKTIVDGEIVYSRMAGR